MVRDKVACIMTMRDNDNDNDDDDADDDAEQKRPVVVPDVTQDNNYSEYASSEDRVQVYANTASFPN
jgi:hypothetical protein